MTITIAVDCMGGDFGVSTTLPAALASLKKHPSLLLVLYGEKQILDAAVASWPQDARERCRVEHTTQVVDMGESPTMAYRKKRDSSMRKAIESVHSGNAQAVVSSGNTGALALISTLVLRPIEGLERSAIAAYLPTSKAAPVLMLDLGANASCTAEHLLQFAVMGNALAQANGIEAPTIGLLNIGEELGKGNDTYKQAYALLKENPVLNFYGNVEGTDIYRRTVDIVVCDGFVGNIALKTSEGLAGMLKTMITEEFTRHWWTKILAVLSYPVLAAFKRRIDHRRFNGAVLLGLDGIVVKSHGSADALAFTYAISRAFEAAHSQLIERLTTSLSLTAAAMAAHAAAEQTNDDADLVESS